MAKKPIEIAPKGFDDYDVKLGDKLRGERATLGKSLLDVQRDLHIKAVFIDAIENCDPSAFQSKGFIAGYIRSYARYLNLDTEAVYQQFCDESGFVGTAAGMAAGKSHITRNFKSPSATVNSFGGSVPFSPTSKTFLENVSLSSFVSVAVLCALVVGLGYGGWSVLKEVQRVQLTPVGTAPELTADVGDLLSESPDASQETGVVASASSEPFTMSSLDQLYRPQELEIPRLISRDGPISIIDPSLPTTDVALITTAQEAADPVVTANGPAPVDIIASQAAWVRVYLADKTVLFEKVLDAGERYRVPSDIKNALLRSGNSGAVYILVGDKSYGPIGEGPSVTSNVSLTEDAVLVAYSEVDGVFEQPLADPLNLKALAQINP